MVASEKCDAYSFGVVALEIMIRRHPGELLSSMSSFQSAQDIMSNNLLDSRLLHPTNLVVERDFILVLKLALHV